MRDESTGHKSRRQRLARAHSTLEKFRVELKPGDKPGPYEIVSRLALLRL